MNDNAKKVQTGKLSGVVLTAKYAKLTTAPCDLINDDEDYSELMKTSPFKALESGKKHESQIFENRAPLPRTGDEK